MKYILLLCLLSKAVFAQTDEIRKKDFPKIKEILTEWPDAEKTWVFIMAGQSNMAGRGQVEPLDTLSHPRLLSIDSEGQLIRAKEPLHWYEPNLQGLDCGHSFGLELLANIPSDVHVVMIPVAVGGSAIAQWIGDSTYRSVPLFTNFKEKVALAKNFGQIKGILWHQGESDSTPERMAQHYDQLKTLVAIMRYVVGNEQLPFILGELGSYSKTSENWQKMNEVLSSFADSDTHVSLVKTADLKHKGDFVHFDAPSQRALGRRFAEAYLQQFWK